MRHDVSVFTWTGGDQNVDARSSRSGSGTGRLEHHGIRGLLRRGDAGDFSNLQAGTKQLDARSAKRVWISFLVTSSPIYVCPFRAKIFFFGFYRASSHARGMGVEAAKRLRKRPVVIMPTPFPGTGAIATGVPVTLAMKLE